MAGIGLRCMTMSAQKRALVVDDSRSARLVLRRMLEKYDLVVDTVESASLALDYLTRNRPDVIFMDHMMLGMDGFEAIRAIKDNPATATIPVMMYTSKGGDLYLGQARALGAVGVLPKTVAPAELFSSLKKIGLIRDRRKEKQQQDEEGASERAEDLQAVPLPARTPRFRTRHAVGHCTERHTGAGCAHAPAAGRTERGIPQGCVAQHGNRCPPDRPAAQPGTGR